MDIKLRLLAGLPINLGEIGQLHPLTLLEITEIGERKYNQHLSALCFEPSDVINADTLRELNEVTSFDIITINIAKNEEYREFICKSMELFFREKVSVGSYEDEKGSIPVIYIGEIEEGRILDSATFFQMKAILEEQNNIKREKEEDYNPANSKAKELIEKIKNNRKNAPKPKQLIDLHSIISGVSWKGNLGISKVWDLTIYQLYDAYYRLNIVDNYDKTLTGIYSGIVDGTKTDFKKINWSNIIKTD